MERYENIKIGRMLKHYDSLYHTCVPKTNAKDVETFSHRKISHLFLLSLHFCQLYHVPVVRSAVCLSYFVWMKFVFDCRASCHCTTVQSCWTVSELLLTSSLYPCAMYMCMCMCEWVCFYVIFVVFDFVYFILVSSVPLLITVLMACFQHNKRRKGDQTGWLGRLLPFIQPQFRKS